MKIHVYTICWNEEKVLPHFFKHYDFADKIIVYDNGSTDNTARIVQAHPKGELRFYHTRNEQDNLTMCQLKNHCWKGDDADWVVVCDCDEFMIGHQRLRDFAGPVVFQCEGWNVVTHEFPNDFSAVRKGVRDSVYYEKCLCFSPRITDINYQVGAHEATPNAHIVKGVLRLYHFNMLSEDYLVQRWKRYVPRMSENDRKQGFGIHYLFSEEAIRERHSKAMEQAVDLPEHVTSLKAYTQAETECASHDPEFCKQNVVSAVFLRESVTPETTTWFRAALGKVVRRELAQGRRANWKAVAGWVRLLCTLSDAGRLGLKWNRLKTLGQLIAARLRVAFWSFREQRRFQAFKDYRTALIRLNRLDFAVIHPSADRRLKAGGLLEARQFTMVNTAGCYSLEQYGGKTFCWTKPVAMLRLDLPPGDCDVTIDTGGLCGDTGGLGLSVFWNEHLLPRDQVRHEGGTVRFAVTKDQFVSGPEQRLTLVVKPLRSASKLDRRLLGVPICSVRFDPSESKDAQAPLGHDLFCTSPIV